MTDEPNPERVTSLTAFASPSPQEVTKVLCREVASSPDADDVLDDVNELISGLERALDEIRLELWLHQSHDEESLSTPVASTAGELLDRLADRIDTAQDTHHRLRTENERLTDRNEPLRRDVERLETAVHQKEARIQELERELERRPLPADA